MDVINLNFTNFTGIGILKVSFGPYIDILGSFFFGILFGFIGTGLYVNEQSLSTITTYLILVGILMAVVLPIGVIALFGLLVTFTLASIFYKTFVAKNN